MRTTNIQAMYIPPSERMKKVHVWMGAATAGEESYNAYFNQEEGISQFSKDIGMEEEYDEDFIGILPLFRKALSVEEVLRKEVPIAIESIPDAVAACERYGLQSVNAVFYLTDSTIDVVEGSYNGLQYIGEFDSGL